jgi:hypothetical protein
MLLISARFIPYSEFNSVDARDRARASGGDGTGREHEKRNDDGSSSRNIVATNCIDAAKAR